VHVGNPDFILWQEEAPNHREWVSYVDFKPVIRQVLPIPLQYLAVNLRVWRSGWLSLPLIPSTPPAPPLLV
jgi:hypothetical protein